MCVCACECVSEREHICGLYVEAAECVCECESTPVVCVSRLLSVCVCV